MKKNIEYINKDCIKFDVHIENAPVPEEANYWGFQFKVTERTTGLSNVFKSMVKKALSNSRISRSIYRVRPT